MPEMFEILKDPAVLAQLDQVCAAYFHNTGKKADTLILEGDEYNLCDKGHWHYNGPALDDG